MLSDRQLLHAIRGPHADDAWASLLDRHGAMVLATCTRVIGDHHDAEEAAQVVFLVLQRKADRLGEVACLAAWLHRTARYVAARVRRTRLRRLRRHAPLGAADAPSPTVDDAGLTQRLDAALDRLPTMDREVLLLHYLEGRSCEGIAAEVGASAATVAMRLSRARERLRRQLRASSSAQLGHVITGMLAMPTRRLSHSLLQAPSPTVHALLHQCLGAMQTAVIGMAASGALGAAAVAVSVLLLAQRVGAAERPAPRPTPAAIPPAAAASQACPLGEPWEVQLQASLQRPVSVQGAGMDTIAVLRCIGDRCGLPMVVDLASAHAALPPITIDAQAVPLGEVLQQIAQQAHLHGQFRGGAVWWRTATAREASTGPVATWMFLLDDRRLERDADPAMRIDAIKRATPMDWDDAAGVGIEMQNGDDLFVTQRIAVQQTIDHLVGALLQAPLRMSDPARRAAETLLPPSFSVPSPDEARWRRAWDHPMPVLEHAPTLDALVRALTAAGVPITLAPGIASDRPLPHRTAEIHLEGITAGQLLTIALAGSGLHAEIRATVPAQGPGIVIADGAPALITRRYDIHPLLQAMQAVRRIHGSPASPWDIEDVIDILQRTVAPDSWSTAGIAIHQHDATLVISQTMEAHEAIEVLLERLARYLVLADGVAALPVPPPVTIQLRPSASGF